MKDESQPRKTEEHLYPEEHLYRGSLEPKEEKSEKKRFTTKQKVAVAVIALMAATGVGYSANALKQGHRTKTEAPANPGGEQQNLSAEAKKFIAEFGNRYNDPVSTYYAEKAYESNSPVGGAVMTDEYVANFDSDEEQMTDGKSNMLGFTKYELLLDKKIDQKAFIEVFNDYIAGGLSNYMNHLAKNPTPEAQAVIDSEFLKFYSDARDNNIPADNTPDKPEVLNLMDTFKGVVAKYGSAANYSVAQANAYDYTDSQEGTIFHDIGPANSGHVEYGGQNVEYFFTSGVDIAINVDVFNGDKSTRATETLKDTELTLWRQPAVFGQGAERYTDISIGQRKIAE